MKTAFIIAKHAGLGNQVQFIPVIDRLLRHGYQVSSDSGLFEELGLPVAVDMNSTIFDYVYIVFGAPWWFVWITRIRFCNSKIYGYKYRIRGRELSLGYSTAYPFDHNKSEIDQNREHFGGNKRVAFLSNHPKDDKLIIIHNTNRPERGIPETAIEGFILYIKSEGYRVEIVGEIPHLPELQKYFVGTPYLSDLIKVCRKAAYYIGPDTGVMHIADYCGCMCGVFFGPTSAVKSGPVNGHGLQSSLRCSPCYKWGKAVCAEEYKYLCLSNASINFVDLLNVFKSIKQ